MSTAPFGPSGSPGVVSNVEALEQVQRDFDAASRVLENEALIRRICEVAVNAMTARVAQGLDIREMPFEPYSEYWACVRAKKGLPTNRVVLHFSGTMSKAVAFKVASPRRASIYVEDLIGGGNDTPRSIVAEGHQWGRAGNTPQREWFGFSDGERRMLERELLAGVTAAILEQVDRLTPVGDSISLLSNRYEMQDVDLPSATYEGISELCPRGEHV